ncbi:hypothetical protein [Tenacibaculum sp. M341]|uniref:hypothetical protein n=1 Tax=Tenacibaculum sp. M341 TaxID=2530339 RepID=UPI00104CC793|nr:hypothetical protein [Tenacibaculum sp. M341]TCI90761.1 hypothetical protein EYW44_13650 [Tenacibaculum sp. M341]
MLQTRVSYLGTCKRWGIPYSCRKTKLTIKWVCNFNHLKEYRWGVFCYSVGCENGKQYKWYAPCLNVFGTEDFFNIEMYFDEEKKSTGSC